MSRRPHPPLCLTCDPVPWIVCAALIRSPCLAYPQQAGCMPSRLEQTVRSCQMQPAIVRSEEPRRKCRQRSRPGARVRSALSRCICGCVAGCCGGVRHRAYAPPHCGHRAALLGSNGRVLVRNEIYNGIIVFQFFFVSRCCFPPVLQYDDRRFWHSSPLEGVFPIFLLSYQM